MSDNTLDRDLLLVWVEQACDAHELVLTFTRGGTSWRAEAASPFDDPYFQAEGRTFSDALDALWLVIKRWARERAARGALTREQVEDYRSQLD